MSQAQSSSASSSIRMPVQRVLQAEIDDAARRHKARRAVGLITNARTGEIIAAASYGGPERSARKYSPGFRLCDALDASYDMGSIFRVFTVAAALDAGRTSVGARFDISQSLQVGGVTVSDFDRSDEQKASLQQVFSASSIGSAQLVAATGPAALDRYYGGFGLQPTGIGLDRTPEREGQRVAPAEEMLHTVVYGRATQASALAMAAAVGALANGGTYLPLTFNRRRDGDSTVGRTIVSSQTSQTLLLMFHENVVSGSAGRAKAPGIDVGGVTGGGDIDATPASSYVGVFPTTGAADATRYVIVIVLDKPHPSRETFGFANGAWMAAPVAARVVKRVGRGELEF